MYSTSGTYSLTSFEMIVSHLAIHILLIINDLRQDIALNLAKSSNYHRTDKQLNQEFEIIKKAQENNRYFTPIYEKYYEDIFIYVNRRVDDLETTADITSMVFYKCLQNLNKFEFRGVPFSAWLFRIAINEINLFFRSEKKNNRCVSLNDIHINTLFEEIETEPQIDRHQLITQLLEQLSAYEIQFLELRFFEGHSFKEIAYLLELSEVNAKVKTYRIIKKLNKYVQKLNLEM